MFDDMISTAGSVGGAAKIAEQNGAKAIYVFATHGVLVGKAIQTLKDSPIEKVIITDSIPLPAEKRIDKIEVLSVDKLLADAIWRHSRERIGEQAVRIEVPVFEPWLERYWSSGTKFYCGISGCHAHGFAWACRRDMPTQSRGHGTQVLLST